MSMVFHLLNHISNSRRALNIRDCAIPRDCDDGGHVGVDTASIEGPEKGAGISPTLNGQCELPGLKMHGCGIPIVWGLPRRGRVYICLLKSYCVRITYPPFAASDRGVASKGEWRK